jgi:hypothetical protein
VFDKLRMSLSRPNQTPYRHAAETDSEGNWAA